MSLGQGISSLTLDHAVLQQVADSLSPEHLIQRCRKWVSYLAPFFSREERDAGCQHRFFITQIEYCHNLIFRRRAVRTVNRIH